uniref:Mr_precursor_131 n=1 Tax=Conus marmoreus TaxID=42752 RepID=U6BZJ1_CONMR|nr:Mr_precursor_131 [Conus marmoreus]
MSLHKVGLEIPLLLSFLYLFSRAESGVQAPSSGIKPSTSPPRAIRSEDRVRRGV